jgi:membrane associated rhomboid family serine protease
MTTAQIAAMQSHVGISNIIEPPSYFRRLVEGGVKSLAFGPLKPRHFPFPPVTLFLVVTCFAVFLFPRLIAILWYGGAGATRAEMLAGIAQNATAILNSKPDDLLLDYDKIAANITNYTNALSIDDARLFIAADYCLIPYQRQTIGAFVPLLFAFGWLSHNYLSTQDFLRTILMFVVVKYALDIFVTTQAFVPSIVIQLVYKCFQQPLHNSYWLATEPRAVLQLPGVMSWINAADVGVLAVIMFLFKRKKMHFFVVTLSIAWLLCVQDKCQQIILSNFALMPNHRQASHQMWRVVTSVFTHAHWLHLLMNMYALLDNTDGTVYISEVLIGSPLFAILVLVCGTVANIIMYIVDRGTVMLFDAGASGHAPNQAYVGFSGVLYGLMFTRCFLLSLILSNDKSGTKASLRWSAWLLLIKELALYIVAATDDSRIFMTIVLLSLAVVESKVYDAGRNSKIPLFFAISCVETFFMPNIAHLIHFSGALCALLFLPFIFIFSPSNSAIRRCIPTGALPSSFTLVAELAGAALVFAILVACFLLIERFDPLPEFDLTWSDVDF